jgi:hypothetical protein
MSAHRVKDQRQHSTIERISSRVRRVTVLASMVTAVGAVVACGSDSATGPTSDNSPLGAYALSSISGKAAPVTMYSDTNYLLVISAGTLDVKSDGSFLAVTTTRETVLNHLSTYVDSVRGTWANGTGSGAIVLTNTDDKTVSNASWGGGKLTLVQGTGADTMTVVYSKK